MTFSIEAAPNGLLTALSYENQKITEELNVVENVVENVVKNVVEKRQEKIIKFIHQNNGVSATQIAKLLNITVRTVQRDLEQLSKQKKLSRIGPAKGGYWQVLKTGNE